MRAVDGELAQGHWQMETKTPVHFACPLRVKSQVLKKGGTSRSGHRRALPACCPPTPYPSPQMLYILLWCPSFQKEHEISSPIDTGANSSLPHGRCVTLGWVLTVRLLQSLMCERGGRQSCLLGSCCFISELMCIGHLANHLVHAGSLLPHGSSITVGRFYSLRTEGSLLLPSALPLSWQSPVNFVGQQEGSNQSVLFLAGTWSSPGLS